MDTGRKRTEANKSRGPCSPLVIAAVVTGVAYTAAAAVA